MRSVVVALAALTIALPPAAFGAEKKSTTPAASPAPAATPNPVPPVAIAPVPAPRQVRTDTQVTPMGALWRSALIPGWGQRYKGEVAKGWVFTGIAAGLLGASFAGQEYFDAAHHSYKALGPNDSAGAFDSKYREEVNARVASYFAFGATGGFWLYNVSDCAFTPLEHLRIKDAKVRDVFPAQYKSYEHEPLATIVVENRSNEPVNKVRLKIEAKDVMNLPAESAVVDLIPPGLGKSLEVTAALDSKKVFEIGEGEPRAVPAKITIEYEVGNKKRKIERTATFTVYGRNAIVWDDMHKLASFITPRESSVVQFASAVTRATSAHSISAVKTIATAAAVHDAIAAAGVRYQPDPAAPFSYVAGNAEAVDSVSFPRETLTRKTGDCDDLTSLYASVLESTGVPTGLVDVPGHVFVVFDSGLKDDEIKEHAPNGARWKMSRATGTAWVPVEVTAVEKSFVEAWVAGSQELQKWDGLGKFNYVETESSWDTYPSSAPSFAEVNTNIAPFDSGRFTLLASTDGRDFASREGNARKEAIASIQRRHLPAASEANEIGIIFAKDGQFSEAEAKFRQAISLDSKLAKAHNNLANILYLQNKMKEAAEEYDAALKTGGENAAILANVANLYYEQGDAKNATAYFERAMRIEPGYEQDYPELAELLKKSGSAVATNASGHNGVSKAANVGAGERDPRHSRWIP